MPKEPKLGGGGECKEMKEQTGGVRGGQVS